MEQKTKIFHRHKFGLNEACYGLPEPMTLRQGLKVCWLRQFIRTIPIP
jgi:hypothetical protein